MSTNERKPDFKKGVEYWSNVEASVNGVLGGFGLGTLPRVDALSSRLFILHLLPRLSLIPTPLNPSPSPSPFRTRALEAGAGIGRVSKDVLLHVVDDVELVEPTPKFVAEAQKLSKSWRGVADASKTVTFKQQGLQEWAPEGEYDVIMAQWCLGHLSDPELVAFLKKAQGALRKLGGDGSMDGVIVVKENICADADDGGPATLFDDEDSSTTRSRQAFLRVFEQTGLTLVKEELQRGFPAELFPVRTFALR